MERGIVGIRVLEVDHIEGQTLFDFLRIRLAARFEQAVTLELEGDPLLEFARRRNVHGGFGVAIENRRIGTVAQQQRTHLKKRW